MAGLCEGGNEPPGSLKAIIGSPVANVTDVYLVVDETADVASVDIVMLVCALLLLALVHVQAAKVYLLDDGVEDQGEACVAAVF
ncbi:hypothetical protein ANN_10995 [Periplaneta americana]|uniref:Uncharacterized protein n=1 Tax=Periplaneta americana TaxID=6978 RepID=A0ABQ8T3T2_PERAM|nr:hypothetical protein ANN_10995 [Periplaneta americana]